MSSNLQRKMIQKNIKKYSEFQIDEWWDTEIGSSIFKDYNSSKQRYSKEKMKTSFDTPNLALDKIPYYKMNDRMYNMILCPSGHFTKGSKKEDDNPIEKMKIEKSFLLGETEVTQEIYESVMGVNPSKHRDTFLFKNYPVEQVSWYDAIMFCNKLSDIFGLDQYYAIGNAQEIYQKGLRDEVYKEIHYPIQMNEDSKGFRLPTEWEWEYAAKAGTQLRFSGSNDPNEVAWYSDNSDRNTKPVKQKKPNAWGFYDMSGNVSEWCENKCSPTDTDISAVRVCRGGSCGDSNYKDTSLLLSVFRHINSPIYTYYSLGFRVCRYI